MENNSSTPNPTPTFTPSRVFVKVDDNSLRPAAIRAKDSGYFVPVNHKVVSGFTPLTPAEQLQASRELLQAQSMDFWATLPELEKKDIVSLVQLSDNFKPIPKEEWIALIKLYSEFCCDTSFGNELEVGALIIVHRETSQLRIVVPEQKVTKTSVDWSITGKSINDQKKIRFLNGDLISFQDLKKDWDILGISHSHNTMFTSPSAVDNKYEVGTEKDYCPTGVHILVGSFKNYDGYKDEEPEYSIYASISHLGRRTKIEEGIEALVEPYTKEDWKAWTFHADVLKGISKAVVSYVAPARKPIATYNPGFNSYYYSKSTRKKGFPTTAQNPYAGPKAPGKSRAAQKWNLDRTVQSLQHLYHSSDKNHQGAFDILEDNGKSTLREILEFLYYNIELEASEIMEEVHDYFSELGEEVPSTPAKLYDESEAIAGIPSDEEILNLLDSQNDIGDPFHYKEY